MLAGENVWWSTCDEGFHFYDSDSDPEQHIEGPVTRHFRSANITDIFNESNENWQKLF